MIKYYKDTCLDNISYINEEGLDCVEEFRDIYGYEGMYQASDLGRIKSLERMVRTHKSSFKRNKARILKQSTDNCGYKKVSLKKITLNVHRLVLMAFKGASDLYVDHINNVSDDNRLVNLRYVTPRENCIFYRESVKSENSFVGVNLNKKDGKFQAKIVINRKTYTLGMYFSALEASQAYNKALLDWTQKGIIPNYINPNKTSKYKGVAYDKRGFWVCYNRGKILGRCDTEEEAYNILLSYLESIKKD